MSGAANLNINEVSKMCGLSPSVLRIWELRYGWPAPKRRANGYRSYTLSQVQELKRMAELVKSGMAVSGLIVDGLPRWPANHPPGYGPKSLPATRSLPRPDDQEEAELLDELVQALETRRGSLVKAIIQRSIWQVRPADEAQVILVPTLVGLAELQKGYRGLRDADEIRLMVRERGVQMLRQFRTQEDILVVPATDEDVALAVIVALLISQRGHGARAVTDGEIPEQKVVVQVSDGDFPDLGLGQRQIGRLSSLGSEDATSLVDLAKDHTLPWQAAV